MSEPHQNLLMLGPPGSGKGTQAKMLAARFAIPHVSTGDILRENVARGTALGAKVKLAMDAGQYVSDELVTQTALDRLGQPDTQRGFVLDGYPRTLAQCMALERWLEERERTLRAVLALDVSEPELVRRIAGRRSCPVCNAAYHTLFSPPRQKDLCDRDGAPLVHRSDDAEAALVVRLREYEEKTGGPLAEFYNERGCLLRVEGEGKPEAVAARIVAALSSAVAT